MLPQPRKVGVFVCLKLTKSVNENHLLYRNTIPKTIRYCFIVLFYSSLKYNLDYPKTIVWQY